MIPPISTILTLRKLPLLLHIIVESAAAYTFILKPSCQLPPGLSPPNSDQPFSSSPTTCFTSGSSSCPSPEETRQQPSKRHLPPSSPSSPSPNPPQLNHNHKDSHSSDPAGEKAIATAAAITELNLILRNYGGLLLSSNLLCLLFLLRPVFDELSGAVSLCTATYHVWPAYRAWARIRLHDSDSNSNSNSDSKTKGKGETKKAKAVLGGPVVHLLVHLGLLGGLVLSGLA